MYSAETHKDLLLNLNPAQKAAVLATDGPLLIVAGAGAGKTKTLTHRIGHIIEGGVPGGAILAITFTNKAAKEMRERVFSLLGVGGDGSHIGYRRDLPFIGTFHGLGISILREKGTAIGIPRSASILAQDESLKLIKLSMLKAGIDPKQFEPRKIQGLISRHKGNLGTPETIESTTNNRYLAQTLKRVFVLYEDALRNANVLDFDDLLEKTVKLLESHEDILRYYQTQWQYIHVDEYQDTNQVQYQLVKLLSGEKKNICVVGDSDQNIYSWRGASIANILNFEEDYPGARVILLEQNYRSTQNILSAANGVIAKNTMRKIKNLFTENVKGEQLSLFAGYDETDEARFVAMRIAALCSGGAHPSDIAVLYRTNFQSRVLEEALLFAGIPYQVLGVRFYERKEVKDVLAYLKASQNPNSPFDLERIINIPARGVGKVTLAKILAGNTEKLPAAMREKIAKFYALLDRIKLAGTTMKPSQLIAYIIKETGIESMLADGDEEDTERLANVRELVSVATRYDVFDGEEGIEQFLADVALESDQDTMKGETDAVRLMTIHASKGLEFPNVFITGMEQDLFPSRRSQDESKDQSEREEERRLFYVALTRAANKVFLTYASFRTIFGSRTVNIPSEFLNDIDAGLLMNESREGDVFVNENGVKDGKRVSLLGWDDDNDDVVYI
ncbi:MAG: ATP-dependent DNA helicase PcrA [Parcubacteria group bacterium GW2011_GWA2_47_7]|nr:MAG: ATP-dependent DNA helicase PcrA [Parcubacteria group bacterium GW2011_GWA2_47_7]